jgi:hypothetical protein
MVTGHGNLLGFSDSTLYCSRHFFWVHTFPSQNGSQKISTLQAVSFFLLFYYTTLVSNGQKISLEHQDFFQYSFMKIDRWEAAMVF